MGKSNKPLPPEAGSGQCVIKPQEANKESLSLFVLACAFLSCPFLACRCSEDGHLCLLATVTVASKAWYVMGVASPEARVTCGYELLDMNAGNRTWSSGRAAGVLITEPFLQVYLVLFVFILYTRK